MIRNLPVDEQALTKPVAGTLCQEDIDKFLGYVFSFSDPVEIGRILHRRGYSPSTEVNTLINIVIDDEVGPKAKMGAIAMLEAMRQKALIQSGALVKLTARDEHGNVAIEQMRMARVTTQIQRALDKEAEHVGQLPGEHKPPIEGTVLSVVREQVQVEGGSGLSPTVLQVETRDEPGDLGTDGDPAQVPGTDGPDAADPEERHLAGDEGAAPGGETEGCGDGPTRRGHGPGSTEGLGLGGA